MSKINEYEKIINDIAKNKGYDSHITISTSNRRDLGEFQINDAMTLAKIYHKNPVDIAKDIKEELDKDNNFENINIAGAGFINVSISNGSLIKYINEIKSDINNNIDKMNPKNILLDYGGANVAKTLHVGHLRSANIGEALKRLAKTLGHNTISDVHLGDSGLQAGLVVLEIKNRYKDLPCFKENYNGEDFNLPITIEDLKDIYPTASQKSKEDENYLNEARQITYQIQNNDIVYTKIWEKVSTLSKRDIKNIYDRINTNFDLWEGEMDSFKYIKELFKYLESKNLIYESDGAIIMDVKEDTDDKEIPPLLLRKSDGAYLYATTDLATIYGRMKRFKLDEIWYTTDIRQELHFTQVFRGAYKSKIVDENTKLGFYGFGTMNGKDGKPFKTRSGGVMPLEMLINLIKDECKKRINRNIVEEEKVEETSELIAIAALKYADLLPFRATDYCFDPAKFSDLDGKTGPYLLYSTIRMKSLLNKADESNIKYNDYKIINNETDKEIVITLLTLPNVLKRAYDSKSINEIAEYIYKLTSIYNKFYSENKIITLENEDLRESWLVLTKVVYDTNMLLLNIMGIKCPEKM
ncbi:MAG: arginine--tRNA ligase [Bacilli bacterium]|nr:arginine--tRNA ligase [Bacilli bacterium]